MKYRITLILSILLSINMGLSQSRIIYYGVDFRDLNVHGKGLHEITYVNDNMDQIKKLGKPIEIIRDSNPAFSSVKIYYSNIELYYENRDGEGYTLEWIIWKNYFSWRGLTFTNNSQNVTIDQKIRELDIDGLKKKDITFNNKNQRYKDEHSKFGLDESINYKSYLEFVYDKKGKVAKVILRFNHL